MFSSVTIIAVTRNEETIRCLRAMSFNVLQCDRVEEILDHMELGDILFLDNRSQGGTDIDMMLLARWTRDTHKPVCLVRETLTREEVRAYRVQGVWDVCERWDNGIAELQAIFRRYGVIMLNNKKIEELKQAQEEANKRLKRLQKAVIGLALLVAGIGGIEIIPKVLAILPF